jgi:hypothetical protein
LEHPPSKDLLAKLLYYVSTKARNIKGCWVWKFKGLLSSISGDKSLAGCLYFCGACHIVAHDWNTSILLFFIGVKKEFENRWMPLEWVFWDWL